MNKTYVFLSHPISGIGGAELYVRDKKSFLEREGYEVLVFSGYQADNIVIRDFQPYAEHVVPELLDKPQIFSRSKVTSVIARMAERIGKQEEVIIEASDLNSGMWGELLAKRLQGRNVVFCLSETFPKPSEGEIRFMEFKMGRRELYGINPRSISLAFGKKMDNSAECHWNAVCDNSPIDVPNAVLDNIHKKEFNLGSIGRYNKPCVPQILEGFSEFAKRHPSNSINVILLLGDYPKETESEINNLFSGCENVSLYLCGPLVPIPRSLFNLCDVFVSTAGCASISRRMKVPTITLDVKDHQAIGILGLTTANTTYRDTEPQQDLVSLLDCVLVDKFCDGKEIELTSRDIDREYRKQLSACLTETDKQYFDVSAIELTPKLLVQKVIRLFGQKFYNRCRQLILSK